MAAAADSRAWTRPACLVLLALGVGVLAGVDPFLGLAATMAVAFVTIVMADLSVGLCIYALLAFLNIVPHIGGPFLSFDKVAGALLALSWLATVAGSREVRRAFASAHPQFFAVLAFFLAWVVLSLTWSEIPSEGFEFAIRYVLNAFLFLIVFTAVRTRKQALWLLGAFVAASTLSAAYGLAVPPDPTAEEQDRLAGTIGEPNQLAAVLVAGLVLSLALGMVVKRHPLLRIGLFIGAVLCLLAIFLTLSRAGLVALVFAMVAAVFVAGRWRAAALSVAAATAAALVVFFGFVATQEQLARVTYLGGGGSGRQDIWTIGWRMVQDKPIHGIGVGQFQTSAVHYLLEPGLIDRSDLIVDQPKVAHNIYLQIQSELGIVGLLTFLTILGFSLRCCLRAARLFERKRDSGMELVSRAVFVGLIGILTADFFASEQFSKQLWLLLGMGPALLAMATRAEDPDEDPEEGRAAPSPLSPARLEPGPAVAPRAPVSA